MSKQEAKSPVHRPLADLEPRKSDHDVRGGRLSLAHSSVRVTGDFGILGKKATVFLGGTSKGTPAFTLGR